MLLSIRWRRFCVVAEAPAEAGVLAQITSYAEQVLAGDIVAGKPVRLACERHVRDLEDAHERGFRFDEAAAQHVIDFIQHLRHSKGEWAGQYFKLEPWQVFIVGSVFGWLRADGTRRFREVYTEIARKNGKTQLLAAIGLYLAFADGEPGAEVYAAATKREQAHLLWGEARRMVRQTPALASRLTVSDSRSNMSWAELNAKFEPLSRDAKSLDGLNPHGALIDELHAHPNREMVDVLETAQGARRQPLTWYITTAGHDQSSIWWEKRSYALMVLDEAVEDDSVFVYIATLDEGDDWRDESVWVKANPNLGVSIKVEKLREEAAKAEAQPARQNAFLRLRMNTPTEQAERWIEMSQWDACSGEPVAQPGDRGFAALDLASTIDLSAGVAVFPRSDGSYDVLCRFWRPEDTILEAEKRDRVPYRLWADQGYLQLVEGSMMDPNEIADDWLDWLAPYDIVEYPFDTWNARGAGARMLSRGAHAVAMAQGYQTYSEPCNLLEGLLSAGKLRHGGHPILRWMAGQVMIKHGPNESKRPWKPDGSGIRDDGITALLMALARAMVHQEASTASVYEERGVLVW